MYFLLFVPIAYLKFFSIYITFLLEDFISCIAKGVFMYHKSQVF